MALTKHNHNPLSTSLYLLDLPIELIVCIIRCVGKEDRCRLRCVCKDLKSATDHPSVWRQLKVELTGIHLKKTKKHLWDTVRARNLSTVSLSSYSTLPARDLSTLLNNCPNLKNLTCSCNIMEWIAAQPHNRVPQLDTLSIYMKDCNARRRGSCLQNLHRLRDLRSLCIDKIYSGNTLSLVLKYTQKLTHLEKLEIRVWVKDLDLNKRLQTYYGFTVADLPKLKVLRLYGFPVDSVMFLPAEISNDEYTSRVAEEDTLQNLESLDLENVLDLEEWVHTIQKVSSLTLTLKASQVNPVIQVLKDTLTHLTHLKVKADGLSLYPITFDYLPATLTSFTLGWTIGGMVRKVNGVLHQFPQQLRGQLQHLHMPQIRLAVQDLDALPLEFPEIRSLSFSLSDEVQGNDLLRLAELPHLHTVCLWFSLQRKFEDHALQLKQLSDNRIHVAFSASMSSL